MPVKRSGNGAMSDLMHLVLAAAVAAASAAASATPTLGAEQNGSQKKRYVVTVDGTNCRARPADAASACASSASD